MRLLLTRAAEDAAPLARTLGAQGFECRVEPMLSIEPVADAVVELDGVQALLFTSANGVRAFAGLSPERALPVFAVGDATAAAARSAGFVGVESAQGDVESLADLVARRLEPGAGALFHGAAREVAGDLAGRLKTAGFEVRRSVLYAAEPRERLSGDTYTAIRQGEVDAVTFFSPRTAETFVRLIEGSALGDACTRYHAVCLSAAVADRVSRLDWAGVAVAERPDQESLVRLLVELRRKRETAGREASGQASVQTDGEGTDKSMAQDQETETPEAETPEAGTPEAGTSDAGSPEADRADGQPPALQVIAAFGGIRPMAAKLGIAVSTVQGWRERAVIPAARHEEILSVAAERAVAIDADLVRASGERPPEEAEPAQPESQAPSAGETAEGQAAEAAADEGSSDPEPSGAAATEAEPAESLEAVPVPTSPPAAAKPRRVGLWIGFLLGVLVLAAGLAAAVYTRDLWQPYLPPAGDPRAEEQARAIESLDSGLAGLEAELARFNKALGDLRSELEARPAATPSPDLGPIRAELSSLDDRLETVESMPAGEAGDGQVAARLAAIEQRLDALAAVPADASGGEIGAALSARLDTLEQKLASSSDVAALAEQQSALVSRLERIEAETAEVKADAEARAAEAAAEAAEAAAAPALPPPPDTLALLLSLDKLQLAVADDRPYAHRFEVVQGLAAGLDDTSEPLAVLATSAESGVATREQLRARFPEVARDIVAAGSGDGQADWSARLLRSLSGIVSVRRTGEIEGDSAEAIAARAEQRVAADDLAGALAELDGLSERAAADAGEWRREAEQRLAVEQAIETLSDRILARLAPSEN